MSVTVTEASAINRIIDHLTQSNSGPSSIISLPDDDQVKEAAKTLARAANKRLSAGWHPDEVEANWPKGV